MSRAYGLDVSTIQDSPILIDWEKVASLDSPDQPRIEFVYAKCTSGTGHDVDPFFASNVVGVKRIERLVGAYHWWVWIRDPVLQASDFEAAIEEVDGVDLPWAIDFEHPPPHEWTARGVDPNMLAPSVLAMVREVRRRSGKRPVLYTYPDFKRHLPTTGEAGEALIQLTLECDLWIASGHHYLRPELPENHEEPPAVLPWASWSLWQFGGGTQSSGTVKVPGIAGYCDRDVFHGDALALRTWASGSPYNSSENEESLEDEPCTSTAKVDKGSL